MMQEQFIVETLRAAWPEVTAIYLFGSFASGDQRPGSDIDLAVLGPGGAFMPKNLYDQVQPTFDLDLDLIDLRSVSTVLQKEIVDKGRLLWDSDRFEREMFELFVWSSYQRLNEERSEIVADGLASGSFYHR